MKRPAQPEEIAPAFVFLAALSPCPLAASFGHVTIRFVPGAKDQAQAMLLGRQA
jgi:hypothetical protein